MLRRGWLYLLAGLLACLTLVPMAPAAGSAPWPASRAITPRQAAAELRRTGAARPKVIQVGFLVLYKGGHIPGAIYAGPASSTAGRQRLRRLVAHWPRRTRILIYCGCCPMTECPNIRPAWQVLQKMGFRRVQVIELPANFARDWVRKGLPHTRD